MIIILGVTVGKYGIRNPHHEEEVSHSMQDCIECVIFCILLYFVDTQYQSILQLQ